jgi:hypothetical protein
MNTDFILANGGINPFLVIPVKKGIYKKVDSRWSLPRA